MCPHLHATRLRVDWSLPVDRGRAALAPRIREITQGKTIEFINDPDPELACKLSSTVVRCFSDMIDVVVATGLTVETRTEERAPNQVRIVSRFCFDQVLAERASIEYSPEIRRFLLSPKHRPRCNIDPWPNDESDRLLFTFEGTPYGTIQYELMPRSVFGIFQFLGRILKLRKDEALKLRNTIYQDEDRRILAISHDRSIPCDFTVTYHSEYYCIPQKGAQNTKRILTVLAYLLSPDS